MTRSKSPSKADSPNEEEPINYEIGDHVYTWLSFMGVPFAMQQHGIVVGLAEPGFVTVVLFKTKNEMDGGEKPSGDETVEEKCIPDSDDPVEGEESHTKTTPAEDGENATTKPGGTSDRSCSFVVSKETIPLETARRSWHKIPYGVHWTQRVFTRAGTANPVEADHPNVALNRVSFLWHHQSDLLEDLAIETTRDEDISECLVVWCKTGNFYSYHGMAKMGHHGADMGSNATLAGGICSQLAASAFVPVLLPVFAVYDVAVAVKSFRDTHSCQKEWARITTEWNDRFLLAVQEWRSAARRPALPS